MALKPQDVFVVLKLLAAGSRRLPYAELSRDLAMSASEVHACVKRAHASGLLHGPALGHRPNISAIEEFLVHGLRYAFPAERGTLTRGVATSYAADPLRHLIASGDEPVPVWPYEEGPQRGIAFAPLYKTAPLAALRDPAFHEYLALVDALRDTRIRERKCAQTELHRRLTAAYAAHQS